MAKTSLYKLTSCALMTALLCVLAPVAIPVGPIPVTLATLLLYLCIWLLDTRRALISTGLYLLLGIVGLPVFSGWQGGLGKVAGPTGGYLVGYLLLVLVGGLIKSSSKSRLIPTLLGMVLGTVVLYAFGTAWFIFQTKSDILSALSVCVVPFIGFDLIKIALAAAIGIPVINALRKAELI